MNSPAAPLLEAVMKPLMPLLTDAQDIAIQQPNECWVRDKSGWTQHEVELSLEELQDICTLAAAVEHKDADEIEPILDTRLPTGERFHASLPPTVPRGWVSITIRKHDSETAPLSAMHQRYTIPKDWNRFRSGIDARQPQELKLIYADVNSDIIDFLRNCVKNHMNIMMVGETGDGKTDLLRTLAAAIDPTERLITVEDSEEIKPLHPNYVPLLFKRDDLDTEIVNSETLLQGIKRMRPDRVILGEIRGKEAWTLANEIAPAHQGTISTIHGHSIESGVKRYYGLCKANPTAATFDDDTLIEMIRDSIDVMVPLHQEAGEFNILPIWFAHDPDAPSLADIIRGN